MAMICPRSVTGDGRRHMRADVPSPVLVLNSGSSSLKYGLYFVDRDQCRTLFAGSEESVRDLPAAVARVAQRLVAEGLPAPAAVGHRIVHGGAALRQHVAIDDTVMRQLDAAKAFAPLHVPQALELVRAAQDRFPHIPHLACLDTAFHFGMPDVARTLPIAREFRDTGVERYGFHGLSCESIVRQLADTLPRRLIIAHLGHGASVTAVANGRSIDTSMGLTPTGGVIMSTRCGDIDPGIVAYLIREHGYDAAQVEQLIDDRSGMLGVSGLSDDMRVLHTAAAAGHVTGANAQLAIDMFCYSVRKQVGAMAMALDGVDLLVFTGGIGENDAATRFSISDGLGALGLCRNPDAVRVLPSQEGEQIARHSWRIASNLQATPSAN